MLSKLTGATALLAVFLVAAPHHTATGTMTAYDVTNRVLTVRSATGSTEFQLAPDARVWLGNRRLPLHELGAHAGGQVTVAWSESGGVRTTHTVRVTDSHPRGR